MQQEAPSQQERLNALRKLMKEHEVQAYVVTHDDAHIVNLTSA